MSYEDLEAYLQDFFADRSRPAAETKDALERISDTAMMMAATIILEEDD